MQIYTFAFNMEYNLYKSVEFKIPKTRQIITKQALLKFGY